MFFILVDQKRRENCIAFIGALDIGTRFSVEIKKYQKNRSRAQNRLYWSYLNAIGDFNGDSAEDLHELFKAKFLGYFKKKVMGEEIMALKSTTDLSTVEFGMYLAKVEAVAKNLGIVLPVPDDRNYAMHGE